MRPWTCPFSRLNNQLPQPVITGEMLQTSDHLHALPTGKMQKTIQLWIGTCRLFQIETAIALLQAFQKGYDEELSCLFFFFLIEQINSSFMSGRLCLKLIQNCGYQATIAIFYTVGDLPLPSHMHTYSLIWILKDLNKPSRSCATNLFTFRKQTDIMNPHLDTHCALTVA